MRGVLSHPTINKQASVSVIGIRAFPAEFIGTSGVEFYTQELVTRLKKYSWRLYVRNHYQRSVTRLINKKQPVIIREVITVHGKVLETLVYSFVASWQAAFDPSRLVWYHGVGPAIWSVIPRVFGKKVLVTIHSLDWRRRKWSGLERRIFFWFIKQAINCSNHLCVVSEQLKIDVEKLFGKNSTVVFPGKPKLVNISPLEATKFLKRYRLEDRSYVLYLGRIVPEKRIEWLIEAFLETKSSPHRLVIAGFSGNMPTYYDQLKKQYSCQRNILWIKGIFGTEKQILLHHCVLLVLPSELEGNPLVLLEAMAHKKNCLVSDEVVRGDLAESPYLHIFPSQNHQSFKLKLATFLKRSSSRSFPSTITEPKNISLLKKYSWNLSAQKMQKMFNAIS